MSFDVEIPRDPTEGDDQGERPRDAPALWLRAAVVWAAEEFAAHRLNRHGEYAPDLETTNEIDCIGELTAQPAEVSRVARRAELPVLEPGAVLYQFESDPDLEVRKLLEPLDELSRRILLLRFGLDRGEPRTLEEVGAEVGLSRQDVRRIEKEAFDLLHRLDSTQNRPSPSSAPDPT